MRGASEDLVDGAEFDEATDVHDGDASGELSDNGERVGDEQIGERELLLKLLEQGEDLCADRDVEGGDRFVGDNEPGAEDQRAGDTDALALSAGELVGIAPGGVGVEADGGEGFEDTLAAGCAIELGMMDGERLGDDGFDAEARVERGERVLKDHLHVAAESAEVSTAGGEEIATEEMDGAGVRLDEAREQAGESGLAGAGFADDGEGLARVEVEGDVVHGPAALGVDGKGAGGGGEGFAEGAGGEERGGHEVRYS